MSDTRSRTVSLPRRIGSYLCILLLLEGLKSCRIASVPVTLQLSMCLTTCIIMLVRSHLCAASNSKLQLLLIELLALHF